MFLETAKEVGKKVHIQFFENVVSDKNLPLKFQVFRFFKRNLRSDFQLKFSHFCLNMLITDWVCLFGNLVLYEDGCRHPAGRQISLNYFSTYARWEFGDIFSFAE